MVLTTSGMWTDENRLLQKLHQEAGESSCFSVTGRRSGGVMATTVETQTDAVCAAPCTPTNLQ